jgi:hypothetical protein
LLAGVLIDRNVDVGNAIDVETVILDILNNTHDGRPWLGRVFSAADSKLYPTLRLHTV